LTGQLRWRFSALALLCCGGLALHLFLSILGWGRGVSRGSVHSAGRRVLSISGTAATDGLTGVTRRGSCAGVLSRLAASIAWTCLCCCNAQNYRGASGEDVLFFDHLTLLGSIIPRAASWAPLED
jgi:hypothetical protein